MDSIEKYPYHKTFEIENFSQVSIDPEYRIRDGLFMRNCGVDLNIEVRRIEDLPIRVRFWYVPFQEVIDKVRIRIFLRLANKDEGRSKEYEIYEEMEVVRSFCQEIMELAELVNEENGWLIDGSLVLEFGACVDAVQEFYEIWEFNFRDPLYDQDNRMDVVTFTHRYEMLYSQKHMLAFHSPTLFLNMPTDRNSTIQPAHYNESFIYFLEMTLQAAHGVRSENRSDYWMKPMIQNARMLQLYNVVHYCQYQLMSFEEQLPITENLEFAFEFNTRHYSIHLMKKLESREKLKEILEEMDIQKMSGESMKQCASFFFDGKI